MINNYNETFLSILGNVIGTILAVVSQTTADLGMKVILFLLACASYIVTIKKNINEDNTKSK